MENGIEGILSEDQFGFTRSTGKIILALRIVVKKITKKNKLT